ncbi:MAG: hypothetical protein ACK5Q5_23595 [Planctomycetaceae bacterium]
MIVLLSGDLLFGSRFHSAAEHLGIETCGALSAAQALSAIERGRVTGLCVDLEVTPLDIAEFVTTARSTQPLRIVAYGPHVHGDRLAAAETAGCDAVLSRGEFNRRMTDLLKQLSVPLNRACGVDGVDSEV